MKQSELKSEIMEFVSKNVQEGRCLPSPWLRNAILLQHPNIDGEDLPFYSLCAYEHVDDTVREVVRMFKGETPDEVQLVLDGFSCVQKCYTIVRDKIPTIVPTPQCKREELEKKVSDMRINIAGLSRHVAELERYIEERFGGQGQLAQAV